MPTWAHVNARDGQGHHTVIRKNIGNNGHECTFFFCLFFATASTLASGVPLAALQPTL
jgi:hypothetical protein